MVDVGTAGTIFFFAVAAVALSSALCGARLRARRQRCEGEDYTRLVGERSTDGMVVSDLSGQVLWCNDAYCRLMRRDRGQMIGRHPLDYAFPADLRPPAEDIAEFRYAPADDGTVSVHRNIGGDGTEHWVEIATALVKDEQGRPRAILACRDATEKIEKARELSDAYDRIEKIARQDLLTGVANRGEFLRVAGAALAPGLPALGLLHLDVDRFKQTNDTVGHAAGDAVLCHIARVLTVSARSCDTVARLGGDEFVLVCPGIGDAATLEALARRIGDRLNAPIPWHGRLVPTAVSIGGALAEGGDLRPEDLLSRSDVALYAAKRAGRGRVRIYDAAMHRTHVTERRLREEIRRLVREDRLEFAFHPTMDMQDGRIRGFETRVAWPGLRGGNADPEVLRDLARALGLAARIDLAAMEAAFALHRRLRDATGRDMLVGFNASADLLADPGFPERLKTGMDEAGVPPDCVVVEVLETVFFGDDARPEPNTRTLHVLRDLGVRVLLDDFGMGHAGLSHLAMLPVTGVKLDRSLVLGVDRDARKAEIVRALCRLAVALDIHIVVDGVGSPAQLEMLQGLGRIVGQGDMVSPPLTADEVLPFLEARRIAWEGGMPPPADRPAAPSPP